MLVDWLVEVVDEFQLSQETLFLAITLLDRFMSVKPVLCCQLQLLGVTCLWVAAKYEEVMPPSLQVGTLCLVACINLLAISCSHLNK
jgi:cyclin A